MRLFLKHNKGYILIYFISIFITIMYSWVKSFLEFGEIIYILIFNSFILICFLFYKYYQNRELYKLFNKGLHSLDESLVNLANADLSRDFGNILKDQYSLYLIENQRYNKIYKEHLEFINQWVHQMKTPLSIIELHLKEFEGEQIAFEIQDEVSKLDNGLNLAMYYARLDSFKKDFLVDKIELRALVSNTINKNKKLFIKNGIVPRIKIEDDIKVYSDGKWLKFVLEQLITNGVKYSKGKGKELIIKAYKSETEVKLSVEDNGVGISKKDIKRVFDQFFTGENGRSFGESTGMGLYISKKICEELGHKIEIESILNEGTTVTISFISE